MSVSIGSILKEKLEGSTASVDMTVGNIRKMIVTFAIPIMVENLFQQMYSMVDTAVVGPGVGAAATRSATRGKTTSMRSRSCKTSAISSTICLKSRTRSHRKPPAMYRRSSRSISCSGNRK